MAEGRYAAHLVVVSLGRERENIIILICVLDKEYYTPSNASVGIISHWNELCKN